MIGVLSWLFLRFEHLFFHWIKSFQASMLLRWLFVLMIDVQPVRGSIRGAIIHLWIIPYNDWYSIFVLGFNYFKDCSTVYVEKKQKK